jgi:protein-S-isoprenylcysteine O-methyltransferase Ste14
MTPATQGLVLLALAWLAYFAIHSLLASLRVKTALASACPRCMSGYRLVYNLLAVALLAPPLWLTFNLPGEPLWQWRGTWGWLADGAALLALAGFGYSLRFYDGSGFLGLRQLRDGHREPTEPEGLCISPLHRWVRHPWYTLGLVVLWSREMNAPLLFTSLLITGYFAIGSRLEERKLLAQYGAAYARYRQAVPGLLPRPWRHLTAGQARTIEAEARSAD